MTRPSAPMHPAGGVAWTADGEGGGRVYVATVPSGPIAVLEGTAALVWELALEGPRATLAERVAAATGQSVSTVEDTVADFVARLLEQGLLEDDGQ